MDLQAGPPRRGGDTLHLPRQSLRTCGGRLCPCHRVTTQQAAGIWPAYGEINGMFDAIDQQLQEITTVVLVLASLVAFGDIRADTNPASALGSPANKIEQILRVNGGSAVGTYSEGDYVRIQADRCFIGRCIHELCRSQQRHIALALLCWRADGRRGAGFVWR